MTLRSVALVMFMLSMPASWASAPGQPLDCSDWVFLEPGHSCQEIFSVGLPPRNIPAGSPSQFDNGGRLFRLGRLQIGDCGNPAESLFRTQLEWLAGGTWNVLGYADDRCATGGGTPGDILQPMVFGGGGEVSWYEGLTFDASNGRMVVGLRSTCRDGFCDAYPPEQPYPPGRSLNWLAAINGFATTFEVLQTYNPTSSTLSFRVPYMPEGMGGADSFDTYWGNLTKPLDFAQAKGLRCHYPASPPGVGDYLTVADTLPTPAPGQGYYYVTAATYQGQTRYGRKASAGVLSGRDPILLPPCNQ